jgi:type VI secretion system secreted protein Hcp
MSKEGEFAMPMPFHMEMTGNTQGPMTTGCCDIQGREDTCLCQALEHSVMIPNDRQTGLPTGKRVHGPVKVTKVFDMASPKIYQALVTGEQLSEVIFKFYRIDPTGTEEQYFTIKLENAIIVSVSPWIPNCLDPAKESFTHMEDVSMTYRTITWTWEVDGVEAQDDWTMPV